jgi:hypothetical protein
VTDGKTVCTGCTRGCSDIVDNGIIADNSFVVDVDINNFFGSGFFGITGTHSFSMDKQYIIYKYMKIRVYK